MLETRSGENEQELEFWYQRVETLAKSLASTCPPGDNVYFPSKICARLRRALDDHFV